QRKHTVLVVRRDLLDIDPLRQPDVPLEPPEAALDAAEGLVVALLVLRRLRPGDPQEPVLHRDLEILARDARDLDRAADLVVRLDNGQRREQRTTRQTA